jgi:cytochrome P450
VTLIFQLLVLRSLTMFILLAAIACLTCVYIFYAFTGPRFSGQRLRNAFCGADSTQRFYQEAWNSQTVVPEIYGAHGPTRNGYKYNVVCLAPNHYSISDPQLVRSVFASAPKTDFYTNNFSHAPLTRTAFEMVHAGDVQRRKTHTGGFLRLQNWEWSRFENAAGDVCQRLSTGLDMSRETSTTIDIYDHIGAACMELGLRAMIGERSPSLVPLNAQGRTFTAETSTSYNNIGCSRTEQPGSSTIDAWCLRTFQNACKTGEEGPRILESLRRFSGELGTEEVANIAAAEVSDDAIASLSATLLQRLAEHHDWQRQVHKSLIDRVASEPAECWLRRSVSSSCKLLGAVFWETLRLSSPVAGPQPRVVMPENNLLRDWGIEAGSIVTASAFVVNRSSVFGPDPHTWDPQRWLEASDETARRWQRQIFTFGSGPRACEGRELAKFICLAVTAWVVMQYDLTSDFHGMEASGGFMSTTCNATQDWMVRC